MADVVIHATFKNNFLLPLEGEDDGLFPKTAKFPQMFLVSFEVDI